MKYSLRGILVTSLALIFAASVSGKTKSTNQDPSRRSFISKAQSKVGASEEQMIRALYDKVTKLNRASLMVRLHGEPTEDQILRFELHDFKVGPIEDILGKRADDVITGRAGPFVELAREVTQLNGGPEHVGYGAKWIDGEYASIYDPAWTINDLLNYQPAQNVNLRRYVTYEVRIRFQGKQRDY